MVVCSAYVWHAEPDRFVIMASAVATHGTQNERKVCQPFEQYCMFLCSSASNSKSSRAPCLLHRFCREGRASEYNKHRACCMSRPLCCQYCFFSLLLFGLVLCHSIVDLARHTGLLTGYLFGQAAMLHVKTTARCIFFACLLGLPQEKLRQCLGCHPQY
jgi:hypothetical protein